MSNKRNIFYLLIFVSLLLISYWSYVRLTSARNKKRNTGPCFADEKNTFVDPYGTVYECDGEGRFAAAKRQPAHSYDGDKYYFDGIDKLVEQPTATRDASLVTFVGLDPWITGLDTNKYKLDDNGHIVYKTGLDDPAVAPCLSDVDFKRFYLEDGLGNPYWSEKANGEREIMYCDDGSACVPTVGCSKIDFCVDRPDGLVVIVNDKTFVTCEGGKSVLTVCGDDEYIEAGRCLKKTECMGLADGTVVKHGTDWFEKCVNEKPVRINCVGGRVFGHGNKCVSKECVDRPLKDDLFFSMPHDVFLYDNFKHSCNSEGDHVLHDDPSPKSDNNSAWKVFFEGTGNPSIHANIPFPKMFDGREWVEVFSLPGHLRKSLTTTTTRDLFSVDLPVHWAIDIDVDYKVIVSDKSAENRVDNKTGSIVKKRCVGGFPFDYVTPKSLMTCSTGTVRECDFYFDKKTGNCVGEDGDPCNVSSGAYFREKAVCVGFDRAREISTDFVSSDGRRGLRKKRNRIICDDEGCLDASTGSSIPVDGKRHRFFRDKTVSDAECANAMPIVAHVMVALSENGTVAHLCDDAGKIKRRVECPDGFSVLSNFFKCYDNHNTDIHYDVNSKWFFKNGNLTTRTGLVIDGTDLVGLDPPPSVNTLNEDRKSFIDAKTGETKQIPTDDQLFEDARISDLDDVPDPS